MTAFITCFRFPQVCMCFGSMWRLKFSKTIFIFMILGQLAGPHASLRRGPE